MTFSASMKVVYFGIAFTLSAALTMLILSFIRPNLDENTPQYVLQLCMLSPLIIGIPYGLRVLKVAQRDGLRLGTALRKALLP
jgi:hypothetical protein